MKGIGNIINIVGKVADDLITSKEEIMKADLDVKKVDASLQVGQMEINKEEAKSKSLFVAGWRPAVGWICAFSLLYSAVIYSFMVFVAKICGYDEEFPVLDATITMQILFGMLGLGAYRTHEKIKGVNSDSVKPVKKEKKGFFSFLKRKR
jgi:hypothetical protein